MIENMSQIKKGIDLGVILVKNSYFRSDK